MRTAAGVFALRPAVFLSRYAFAIYLVHMPFFVGYLTNRFIAPWTLVNTEWFVLMNSLFVFGFVTATAFVVLMGALLPRLSAELLGINAKRQEPRVKAQMDEASVLKRTIMPALSRLSRQTASVTFPSAAPGKRASNSSARPR